MYDVIYEVKMRYNFDVWVTKFFTPSPIARFRVRSSFSWCFDRLLRSGCISINPVDLGCEFAENWLLPSTSTIAIVVITLPISWYSFYRPAQGWRLCRPRHCSNGAQPMPKAVYRSGCRDKPNRLLLWDSNPGRLTPRSDALTTRPLRPADLSLDCWHNCYTKSAIFLILSVRLTYSLRVGMTD